MTFLRHIRIVSWPMWVKLLVGFAVAILLPVILLLIVTINSFRNTNRENVIFYLNEIGSRQRPALNSMLNQAASQFVDFTDVYSLVALLPALRNTEPAALRTLENGLGNRLLDIEGALFGEAWLLDSEGRVVFSALAARMQTGGAVPSFKSGDDASGSPAYQRARNEFEVYQRQWDFVVYSQDGRPAVELIGAIYGSEYTDDKQIVGYLVASLDLQETVFSVLQFRNREDISVRSYLVDDKGRIVADDPALMGDVNLSNSDAVQRALQNERGVSTLTIGSDPGVEFISYYTPLSIVGLEQIRFVLITELDASIPASQISNTLGRLGFPLTVGLLALAGVLVLLFYQLFAPPLVQLLRAIHSMAAGDYSVPVPAADRGDEFGKVASAFLDMRQQVNNLIQDYSLQMTKRARDITTTQEISRFAASERDLQTLLNRVVDLIVERFSSIYHAQIFLADSSSRYAVLRASTGEAGKKLLGHGHQLAVGSTSVIGRVMEEGRVIVARDTATSEIHQRNEFLPDTRAELAIPLQIGGRILGALDVQSKEHDSFTEEHVNVLHTMADQIAIAIQNALFYQESIRRLEEIETANRQATRRAWEEYMVALRLNELSSAAGKETETDARDLRREAIAKGDVVIGERTQRQTIPIAIPITLRGEPLGAVQWELPAEDFDNNKVLLAQELVNRLAISLDNVRLFQQSQQATERERLVNTIASRLTQQTAINDILETAVREVGQALRTPQVAIRLHWDEDTGGTNGGNIPTAEADK